MEPMLLLVFLIGCFLIRILLITGYVPKDTAIIIDRNSHYHKTKKRGSYFLRSNDVVTSYISKRPHKECYSQISESHDGKLFDVSYLVNYEVYDVDTVLERLKSNRRSVTDIIKYCIKTTVESFDSCSVSSKNMEFLSEVNRKLTINLAAFEIHLISMDFIEAKEVKESRRNELFMPHVSSGINPIQYK